MPEIAAIVPYRFLPARSGGRKYIAQFLASLGAKIPIGVLCTVDNDVSGQHPYRLIPVLKKNVTRYVDPALYVTARKLIRDRQIKVLIIEHPYLGWLGWLLKKTCGVKLFVHSHNIEAFRFRSLRKWWWPVLLAYERWVHVQADFSFFIQQEDRELAIRKFGLNPALTDVITYGIDWNQPPSTAEKAAARHYLQETHGLQTDDKIILFTGAFNYQPNLDALRLITEVINPALLQLASFNYKILVCGKDVPGPMLKAPPSGIIYTGFVQHIEPYYRGADLFINPVTEGGGIKTKLVEALASDLTCVSTARGAVGVDPALCNGKLLICGDGAGDWAAFIAKLLDAPGVESPIGHPFFHQFYWDNITNKALEHIHKYA